MRAPATSANLGPGFDSLGLALALYNEVTLEPAGTVAVSIEGEGAVHLPRTADNLVVKGAQAVYEMAGRRFTGLTVAAVNGIPPNRGLGSSAAAWLCGIVGANALLGEPLDTEALLHLAATREGHPDNVAAALLGGLTVSCWKDGRVVALSLPVPAGISWVALVPEVEGSTAEARAVLPPSVPRVDAVFNVQRVALFVGGLQARRPDLLAVAMEDRLHQPYRARLFPWMETVIAAARTAGALACVLSGAGPSLLAAVPESVEAVASAMEQELARWGVQGRARLLDVDRTGTAWETG
ncbi:MAG: homoserine kinase [Candidatus Methylomirabilia bacterium]